MYSHLCFFFLVFWLKKTTKKEVEDAASCSALYIDTQHIALCIIWKMYCWGYDKEDLLNKRKSQF